MSTNPKPSSSGAPAEKVGELFPELSTNWLNLDWNGLQPAKRGIADRLVSLGAAQVQLKCVITKENVMPPIIVMMVASGNYRDFLKERLTGLVAQAVSWRNLPGDLRIEASKLALRWTPDGQKAWHTGTLAKLVRAKTSPGNLNVESCEFADGTPFPYKDHIWPEDAASSEIVALSVKDSATKPTAANGRAILRLPRQNSAPLRSWRKETLDTAILAYRDDPANEYLELRAQSSNPCDAYYRKAQSIFGRNAVARNLGVRGKAMVSKSPVWRAIATELGLLRDTTRPLPLGKYTNISMKQGLVERADALGGSVVDDLIVVEVRDTIDKTFLEARVRLHREADAIFLSNVIDAVLVMLDTGGRTPTESLSLAKLAIEHVRDRQQRIIRKKP